MTVSINGTTGITDVNGTAAAPAITGTDTDSGMYFGTNTVALATNGTNAVYVDASQNVGVGTSSPLAKLEVLGTTGAYSYFSGTSQRIVVGDVSGVPYIQAYNKAGSNSGLAFYNYSGEAMRIDTSGNLLVGTTSSITTNNGESPFTQTAGTDSRWAYQSAVFANSAGTQGGLYLAKSRGTSVGSYTAVQSGDNLGRIAWSGSDGTKLSSPSSAEIIAQVDAAVSTSIVPGRLTFYTANTSGVSTERMRIDSSGNLLVGKTVTGETTVGTCFGASLNNIGLSSGNYFIVNYVPGGSSTMIDFRTAGVSKGSISQNGSNVAYNTSSDYRLKDNVHPMTGALAKIAMLKPCTYTWKEDGSNGEGFIAHELAEVCPGAVNGEKDAVNEDGSIKPQGIDTSFLVATLTAAIQEQQALITALTERITTLENK